MKAKLIATTINALTPESTRYEVRDTEIKGFLLRVYPSGQMTYYLQYRTEEGKQQHFRIGNVGNLKPRQARDIAEKKAGEVASGTDIQNVRKEKRARAEVEKHLKLGAFLEHQFGPWLTEHRKRGHDTLKRLETNFDYLKDKPLADISSWTIEKWRAGRLKEGRARSTLNRDVGDLKAAMNKAVEWQLIDVSPLTKLKPLKIDGNPKVRYLTKDERKRLIDALLVRDKRIKDERKSANAWRKQRDYDLLPDLSAWAYADHLTPLVTLALNTGMRRGELFNLSWDNVDMRGKQITVAGDNAKSGQTRHIPLNNDAFRLLRQWRAQTGRSGLVFPGVDDKPLTDIKNSWRGVLQAAKISKFRFHDLRHDFASRLVMAGVPLNTVRELLGHSDMQTTLRYAHLAPDHKVEAVAKLT